jgi:hypothetical protein
MLFATIATLLATALTASAQDPGLVRATFYRDGGCGPSPWAEDEVFVQNSTNRGVAGCKDLDVGPFASTYFNQSTLTLPSK